MWRERRVEPVSTSTFTDDSGAILAMVVELTCTAAAVAIVLAACDSWSQNKYTGERPNDQLMASTVRCRREDSCHPIPSIARTDRRWFDSGTQYHTIGLRARPKQQQLSYSWLNIVTHRSPHSAQPSVSSREQHLEANVEFSRLTDVLGNTLSATYTLPFDRLLLLR